VVHVPVWRGREQTSKAPACSRAHIDGSEETALLYWSKGKVLNSGSDWYSSSPVLYLFAGSLSTATSEGPHARVSPRTHMKWRYTRCASSGRASTQASERGVLV